MVTFIQNNDKLTYLPAHITYCLTLTMLKRVLCMNINYTDQQKKALLAGDQNKQREIMFNSDPVVQKMLSQEVKRLDRATWDTQKRTVMEDILILKFTQHEDFYSVIHYITSVQ